MITWHSDLQIHWDDFTYISSHAASKEPTESSSGNCGLQILNWLSHHELSKKESGENRGSNCFEHIPTFQNVIDLI